jgi:hypothetical protein
MADFKKFNDEKCLRDIKKDLSSYSEFETTINRVFANILAWVGGNNFGMRLIKTLWENSYRISWHDFDINEIYREYPIQTGSGKKIWADLVIKDAKTFWIIETKTDTGSIRAGQLEEQIEHGKKEAGNRTFVLLAIAPTKGTFSCPNNIDRKYFAEISWDDVWQAIKEVLKPVTSPLALERCNAFAEVLKGIKANAPPQKRFPLAQSVGRFQAWKPGLNGVIYLPDPKSKPGEKDRPYYVLIVDAKGMCTIDSGPFKWATAREEAWGLSKAKGMNAFSCPEGGKLTSLREQGRLLF